MPVNLDKLLLPKARNSTHLSLIIIGQCHKVLKASVQYNSNTPDYPVFSLVAIAQNYTLTTLKSNSR